MSTDEKTRYINANSDEEVNRENTVYINGDSTEKIESVVHIGDNIDDSQTVYIGEGNNRFDKTNTQEATISEDSNRAIEDFQNSNEENDNREDIDSRNNNAENLHYLPVNTMLQKRYRINSVLGEGGFGITYLGWDITLNIPVAIKEYYPSGLVTRNATLGKTTQVISIASKKYGTQFRDGIDRVLDEARRMAKFRNTLGIVGIYDFFEANNTAYIVMEYIEGCTLEEYCKNNRIDNTTLFNMLVPVMDALQVLHDEGIIHRDVSPDNIMVDKDGNFKLLDFGAARGYSEENATTMSVILKKSYAPEEQFRAKGNQGPWTDVYALGATLYKLITGQIPPTSIERLVEDEIVNIREVTPSLTKGQAEAIMTALSVHQKERWQSISEFKNALLYLNGINSQEKHSETEIESPKRIIKKSDNIAKKLIKYIQCNKKKTVIIFVAIIAVIALILNVFKESDRGPGYLGIYSSEVPLDIKDKYSVTDGIYITGVIGGTPAAKSDFVAGDILVSLDDMALLSEDDFSSIMTQYYEGDKVKIKYLHLSEDNEYVEKSKEVKLANKNEQDAIGILVSSVNTETEKEEASYISENGIINAHLDSVSHDSTSYFAYIEFTNETDKDITIKSKDIYLNGIPVDTGGTRNLGIVPANSTLILSSYVSLDEVINKGIDTVETFRIICYLGENESDVFNIEENNLSVAIDYQDDDLEKVKSSKTVNNTDQTGEAKGVMNDKAIENHTEIADDKNSDAIEKEAKTDIENEIVEKEASTKDITASKEGVVISLSDIKEGSSYTHLYFLVENNTDNDIVLTKDWVYLNDTSIKRTTSDGLFELSPHSGSVIEYTFDSNTWSAAKGNSIEKIEVNFKIDDDSEPTSFEIYNQMASKGDSVARLIDYENERMNSVNQSENIEVELFEINEGASYTYITFTIKNKTSSTIDLGKSWGYFNGAAVFRATSEGSHSIAAGKATVIEYAYASELVNVAKDGDLSIIRLQFYINDSEVPELFYFNY